MLNLHLESTTPMPASGWTAVWPRCCPRCRAWADAEREQRRWYGLVLMTVRAGL